jgi:branched-chain amino acid transport system permease protein
VAYAEAIFINAAIYIIAAMGLAVFTGFTGLFSLGHAAFMAVGAYSAAILTFYAHWPLLPALFVGVALSAMLGVMIGYPTLRAKLRSDYFAIATLGFGEAVKVLLENFSLTQGARGLPGIQKLSTPLNTGLFVILSVWLCSNFLRSTYGRKVIAIGQDHVAAEMIGIKLLPNQLLSLGISAGFSGLSGGLLAHYTTFIQPSIFNMDLSSLITAGVVCGGMGSLTGPFVAISLFVVIPELFRGLALWRLVFYGALLVIIINWRPKGLFGHEELSLANLPKLFVIMGITMGLTISTTVYKAVVAAGGYEIFALAVAVAAALALAFAIGLAGRLIAAALKPVAPYVKRALSALAKGFVRALDPILAPKQGAAGSVDGGKSATPSASAERHDGPLLSLKGVRKRFGGVTAVDGIDLELAPGEILGLIGPNGSGKTTVFNLISGVYPIDEGSIHLGAKDITGASPTTVVLSGVSRTFQNIRLFGNMTALDNVRTALHRAGGYSLLEAFLRWPWTVWQNEKRLETEALRLLEVVGLASMADRPARTLAYGLQRKLEIARALALEPGILLLDEPAAGMNPREASDLVDLIRRVHDGGRIAIILIEHHMDVVMTICDRIVVLNFGRPIAEGSPELIQSDPAVLKAYLGDKYNAVVG